jgi:hypothetical protein
MATLTDAQLTSIADRIFVMGDRTTTRLPKPANTGPTAFTTALDTIAGDARFKDAGIGVIDFTKFPTDPPKVWLSKNADQSFRIGSASKIAVMLAAVQLRLDVRRILDLKIISKADEFDALYANRNLWKKAKAPQSEMQQIANSPPLFSEIFDFSKTPVDFDGPDPDKQTDAAHRKPIMDKLPANHELVWDLRPLFPFSERLWLTGLLSDNVSATACASEIGTPYLKAVQRAYGLADPARGMHLFASGIYTTVPTKTTPPSPPPPRPLAHVDPIRVNDAFYDAKSKTFSDRMSWVPGSAAALTSFMLAMIGDKFCVDPAVLVGGLAGCTTIRNNLADKIAPSIASFMADEIGKITTINKQMNKIGILKKSDGAESPLVCEFLYLETKESHSAAHPDKELKYAVIAVGLVTTAGAGNGAVAKSRALGTAVHNALVAL